MNSSSRKKTKTRVKIYSKDDCHLCEIAKAVILKVQRDIPFEFKEVDITSDPTLFQKYQEEIPVVFVDGRKLFKYRVDEQKLRLRLLKIGA